MAQSRGFASVPSGTDMSIVAVFLSERKGPPEPTWMQSVTSFNPMMSYAEDLLSRRDVHSTGPAPGVWLSCTFALEAFAQVVRDLDNAT